MNVQMFYGKRLALGIFFAWALVACQQGDDALNYSPTQVQPRATCGDCGSDCCCYVALDGMSTSATLHLCGTANGASTCAGSGCGGTFANGGQFISLTSVNNREVFCMGLSSPFWIENLDLSNAVDLEISCQAASGIPQTIQIHLEAFTTPGYRLYIETDSDCEVDPC